jgi:membrane fusion protein (multidrug efflux system)
VKIIETNQKWTVLLVLALFLTLGATGCVGNGDAAETDRDEDAMEADGSEEAVAEESGDEFADEGEEAVPVEVAVLSLGPIESVLKASATLEAESQVKVFSEASRQVVELLVEEGDRVRKGQVLLRLQSAEQKTNLSKVQNELTKAEREYARQQRLFKDQLISEEMFNNSTFELEQLQLSLVESERQLSYTTVRAPIGGAITGRLVNLGDQISIGQHLFDIVDFESLVARIYVPEKNLLILKAGLPARISTPASLQKDYRGRVDRIAPIIDAASGTVKVTVAIGGQPGLRPGMYVDVELVTDTRDTALLVPKKALVYDEEQMFVYRVEADGTATKIAITPLLSNREFVFPMDGLEVGDQVIVAGQIGLKDGAKVSLPGEDDPEESEEAPVAEDSAEGTDELKVAEASA